MASVRHLEFGNFWIFVTFPSLCSIAASAYQISWNLGDSRLRYGAITIFKMAAVRHVRFRYLTFSSPNLRTRAIKPPNSKFRLNRTIWSRVIAKNDFQYGVRPPSWIWEFLKFSHTSVAWVKICVSTPNFVIFGRFAADLWTYNDFQNGGRPPCWIYCDVIILYRKTEFNVLDFVLTFDLHRFYIFWYTLTLMFHHFSLKLPIFALILTYFGKIWENIKFKCCNPKMHICAWDHVFWTLDA